MMNQMFWSGFFGKIVCVYNNIKMLDFNRMIIILSGKCDKTKQNSGSGSAPTVTCMDVLMLAYFESFQPGSPPLDLNSAPYSLCEH